jgi:hypothetical protein
MSPRRAAILAALALTAFAIALGGCGDDEEPAGSAATTEQNGTSTSGSTPTTETEQAEATETDDDSPSGGMEAPSKDSGGEGGEDGAGDEVPASSQALITGRGGKLRPSVVHVPPFIAVRVELVSADGVEYELEGPGGRRVKAGGEIRSASATFTGMRAGDRLVLEGPQGSVTIEADAEPGP